MADTIHGSCLCGQLAFAAPLPTKWVAHCHCTMCRRAHGAAFVTWAGFHADTVTTTDPHGALRWYASSPGAQRGFCTRCGSTLFFRAERWADELHIVVANIREPLDRAPQAHVFWDSHVDWADVDPNDGLRRKCSV